MRTLMSYSELLHALHRSLKHVIVKKEAMDSVHIGVIIRRTIPCSRETSYQKIFVCDKIYGATEIYICFVAKWHT
jgi:hypothetical protein